MIPASQFLDLNKMVSMEQFRFGIPSFFMVFDYKKDSPCQMSHWSLIILFDVELNIDDSIVTSVGNVIDVCVQTKIIFEEGAWLCGQMRP